MGKLEVDASQLAENAREFNEIVAPLELRSGQRFTDPGRSACIHAFNENPEEFRSCATRALLKGTSPLGLLVRMVRDGDHRLPAAPPATNGNGARASRELCADCEMPVDGRHTTDCKLAGSRNREAAAE